MATYLDDTFTGTLNTLLDAHTADVGGTWTKVPSSTWDARLSGDGCIFKGGSSGVSTYYKSTTAIAVADYQVDMVVNIKSLLAADQAACYARFASNTDRGYYAVLQQDGTVFLRKAVANVQTTLATGTVSIGAGQSHTLSVRVVGSTITMLWDGSVVTATSGSNPITDTSVSAALSAAVTTGYSSSTVMSASTGMQPDRITVSDVGSVNSVAPVVSGTRVAGQILSCTTGTWSGSPTFTYQWVWQDAANAPISGATSSTYTLVAGDVAHTVGCIVTATLSGVPTTAASNGLVIVAEAVPTDIVFTLAAGSGLGGSPAGVIPSPTSVFDSVSFAEATSGDVEYRLVYLKNTHAIRSLATTTVWIATQTTSPTTSLDIGLAVEPAGTDAAAIANEQTAPAGVTFSAPATEGAGLVAGSLAPGQAKGVWLRWTVLASTAELASDTCSLGWSGTPA